jgi:hypothetical protein
MSAALKLFDGLGIKYVPIHEQRGRGAMATCCLRIVDRMIAQHGLAHTTITLRSITESSEQNQCALIADVILAVSDVILSHPRWEKGLAWLAAFDLIDLVGIRNAVKAANISPMRVGVATLIAVELAKILGPSRPTKPPVRSKAKVVSDNLALGIYLLRLKSDEPQRFAAVAQELHKIDTKSARAYKAMAAAKLYSGRTEITGAACWATLSELSSRSLPPDLRRKFETAITSGQRVRARQIRAARQAHAKRRPTSQPARRMAA